MVFDNNILAELKANFQNKKIAVIGDMMLDCYFQGSVSRISPEAPVPVIEVDNEFFRFGGAANVALNILKLGSSPIALGIIGNDSHGKIFKSLLNESGIDDSGIITDKSRPTTAKTRVIANSQHVVRIDKEKKDYISSETEELIYSRFMKELDTLDAVILQDYNKGVLSKSLITKIITETNKKGIPITVDPKFNNFFEYKNVTVFKPNRKETEDVLGMSIKTKENLFDAGSKLMRSLKPAYLLLTLGEEGIALFKDEKEIIEVPTKARKVADVSGAGDTVISTLTVALAAGATISKASYLANFAGGLVCEEVGIVPIELDKLFDEVAGEIK